MPLMTQERTTTATPAAAEAKVDLTRIIRADRARVFAAWTTPEMMKHWMGPGQMYATDISVDLRPGGAFRVEMKGTIDGSDPNRVVETHGVYQEIVPNERVSYTWNSSWNQEPESLVTVTFRDVPGGTEIRLEHSRVASDATREGYTKGWGSILDKLTKYVEA
jgi:uncharacterized protein YndB with AHSA1/START domain